MYADHTQYRFSKVHTYNKRPISFFDWVERKISCRFMFHNCFKSFLANSTWIENCNCFQNNIIEEVTIFKISRSIAIRYEIIGNYSNERGNNRRVIFKKFQYASMNTNDFVSVTNRFTIRMGLGIVLKNSGVKIWHSQIRFHIKKNSIFNAERESHLAIFGTKLFKKIRKKTSFLVWMSCILHTLIVILCWENSRLFFVQTKTALFNFNKTKNHFLVRIQ